MITGGNKAQSSFPTPAGGVTAYTAAKADLALIALKENICLIIIEKVVL